MSTAYTWLGTTNQNMDTATNWSPNGIPAADDTAAYGSGAVRTIKYGTCLAPFTHIAGGTIEGGIFVADIVNTVGGVIKGTVAVLARIKTSTSTGGYYLYGQGGPLTKTVSYRTLMGARTPPKILFMDDIAHAGSYDGPNGLLMLNYLQQLGYCELIACIAETNYESSPQLIDAINTFYGHASVPIGVLAYGGYSASTPQPDPDTVYDSLLAACPQDNGVYGDSVAVMRQALHDADDASVTLHTTGPLTSLAALLASAADGIDARSGVNLVAAKVCLFQCGAGYYPNTEGLTNFNLSTYVTILPDSIAPARAVLEAWKTSPLAAIPIIYAGEAATGIDAAGGDTNAIIVRGANQWAANTPPYWLWRLQDNIEATDMVRAFHAVFGEGSWWTLSAAGLNTIDAVTGNNTFAVTEGAHQQYLEVPTTANGVAVAAFVRNLMIRAAMGLGGDDHTLVENVVGKSKVLVGNDNYLGGEHGTHLGRKPTPRIQGA